MSLDSVIFRRTLWQERAVRGGQWLLRNAAALGATAAFLYLLARGLASGWWLAALLALPPALLAFVALRLARRWLERRTEGAVVSLRPELFSLLGFLLLGFVFSGMSAGGWAFPFLAALTVSAVCGWLLRRAGLLYASWLGAFFLALLSLCLFLHVFQQRAILYARYLLSANEWQKRDQSGWQEENDGQARRLVFFDGDRPLIQLRLPGELHWRDARSSGFVYAAPELGQPLLFVSAAREDPLRVPALALFYSPELSGESIEAALGESLQHRQNLGEIESWRCAERIPLRVGLSGGESSAVSCNYHDRTIDGRVRLIAAPVLRASGRYTLLLVDPQTPGFPMHPALAAMLGSIDLR